MNKFIRSQILSDRAGEDALRHGFHLETDDATPTELLRRLVEEGMKQELEEVEAIASNPETPTFETTIVAFTRCGELLSRATTVMYNLFSAETCEALDELVNELSPVLTAHSNAIMLNEALFHRVKAVSELPNDELTTEDKVMLEQPGYYLSYGADTVIEQDNHSLTWVKDGVNYHILDSGAKEIPDTLFTMAEELILTE